MSRHATATKESLITGTTRSSGAGSAADGTVGALGEFGLIAALTARLPSGPLVDLGPGDDAAVVRAPDGRVVATTDVLVEGVHFRRDWSTAVDVGHKAAAQSLADVAAMGAEPTTLLVGLAVPSDVEVEWVLGLADGLAEECAVVGASVVGGDVVRSATLTIAVTALGDLHGRSAVTRAGALPGDLVAVCGKLGWAAAGLAVLTRGFRSPRIVVDAHRRPAPPYDAGPSAADAGATAMCDVSDGLLADLGHLAEASDVSIDLDGAALVPDVPLAELAPALGVDASTWVLGGGEDHALVATFRTRKALKKAGTQWRQIGVVAAGAPTVTIGGVEPAIGQRGHDHFR